MIYIFKCFGAVLVAPCKICCGACKMMDECCKAISKSLQDCCSAVTECWAPIAKQPLGGYVLTTFAAMFTVLVLSGMSIVTMECDRRSEVRPFAIANCFLAIVHAFYAFYLQRALVTAIGTEDPTEMSHSEIASKARQVMLYDWFFCIYVIVFPASFFYNCYAGYALGDIECPGSGPAWCALAIMLFFFMAAFWYFFCWNCGQCCFAGKEKYTKKVKEAVPPMPQMMGAKGAGGAGGEGV